MSAQQTIDPKTAKALRGIEVARKRGTAPSAREMFAFLLPKLLGSRPILGRAPKRAHADGTKTGGHVLYGAPTFRNVIDPETGDLV